MTITERKVRAACALHGFEVKTTSKEWVTGTKITISSRSMEMNSWSWKEALTQIRNAGLVDYLKRPPFYPSYPAFRKSTV